MKFPKAVMRKTELVKMGFSKEMLTRIYETQGQKIAWKVNPLASNSPILFDTEGLNKLISEEIELAQALEF